ncbi:condensation domain-containing protein, partial [Fulvivirga imtechensis]|uniref:condensation domain-containing protein n=1 Tax=Fulvivirga imtechensis TaxID=881893 RepID=UPI0012F9625C
MNIVEYIKELKSQNIFIHIRNGELKIKAKKEFLTEDIISGIRSRKEEILEFYKAFNGEATYSSIGRSKNKHHYSVSSVQRRLYFVNELQTSSLAYNMPQVIKLDGRLEESKLQNAFTMLVQRHEVLRTSFQLVDHEVVQVIHDKVEFEIEDYKAANEAEITSITSKFVRPFDLSKAPLIRAGLVTLSDQSYFLMLDVHHIINDWQSYGILINDIVSLYSGETLAPLTLQYKDYAEWQQSEEQQERISAQRDFWKKEFAREASVLDLPTDYPRPSVKNFEGNNRAFILNREETERLWSLAQETETTMFMTILSVFNVLLSKLGNQEDIIVGTPVTGRNHADLEEAVGMFVYTIAIRNDVNGALSFKEFLSNVKEKTLSCLDNEMYPYEELIGELQIPRNTSRNPLFSIMFVLEPMVESKEISIPDLRFENYNNGHKISKFDLTLRARVSKDEIILIYEYSTELFSEETIERFIVYFQQIIKEITDHSERKISEINILPLNEREKLLGKFNDTSADYPRDQTLIALFEEQVQKIPANTALIYEDQELSYEALDARSNQLARSLLERGCCPGMVVGLMVDRSIEMMVGMLA